MKDRTPVQFSLKNLDVDTPVQQLSIGGRNEDVESSEKPKKFKDLECIYRNIEEMEEVECET